VISASLFPLSRPFGKFARCTCPFRESRGDELGRGRDVSRWSVSTELNQQLPGSLCSLSNRQSAEFAEKRLKKLTARRKMFTLPSSIEFSTCASSRVSFVEGAIFLGDPAAFFCGVIFYHSFI